MLQAPAHEELARGAAVLLRQGSDGRICHLERANEGRVGLNDDVVRLAKVADGGACVEGVDLDLIHGGQMTRL